MAVAWGDLVVPTGELDPAWFPNDSDGGEARIEGYITVALLKSVSITDPDEQDAATTAYAYHLAYTAIWLALSAGGSSSAIVNEESWGISADLVANFKLRADEKLAEFEELVPPTVDDVVETAIPPTMSTPVYYGW